MRLLWNLHFTIGFHVLQLVKLLTLSSTTVVHTWRSICSLCTRCSRVCALSYVMANPTNAVVAAALCIALAAAWTALLRNSPIDPANIDLPYPPQRLGVFAHNKRLQNAHKLGSGLIPNPEDLVFDSRGRLYTGCGDGWIKRISFLDNLDVLVENWTYVGGRPLGLALGLYGELLVCEPSQVQLSNFNF